MKYCGKIGFAETVETDVDIWGETITERKYYGDITRNLKRSVPSENLNNNIDIQNTFSIVADPFAYENFFNIRYIEWMGSRWEIKSVEVQRPRLILTVGGVYNGPTPEGTIVYPKKDTGQ